MNTAFGSKIAVRDATQIDYLKGLFERHVDRATLENYRLPTCNPECRVVVGMSGGADSSVLGLFAALYLAPRYNVEFLFTDTMAEPDSCHQTLDAIEKMTGIHVTRIQPKEGLFELIERQGGFLPSTQARWCTRALKIEPLMAYLKNNPSQHGTISLAGIRYDEVDREGIQFQYSMESENTAAFPFIELKITKAAVFDILNDSIGIPATYRYRSRSGCYSCFFQRNQEVVGMLFHDPAAFARTEAVEKLAPEDADRWSVPLTLADRGLGIAYPVPAFIDVRSSVTTPDKAPVKPRKKAASTSMDLFGGDLPSVADEYDDLFAAVALYSNDDLSLFHGREFTPGTYWQEFITISTSMAGLSRSLGTYYTFRKTTPTSIYDLADLKIAIVQIRFPKGAIDRAAPAKASYTWKKAVAYKQLRHLVMHCKAALEKLSVARDLAAAERIIATAKDESSIMAAAEQQEILAATTPASAGNVIWEGLYVPSETVAKELQMQLAGISIETDITVAREDLEFDEVPMACLACSR